jgi:hypothetical protein
MTEKLLKFVRLPAAEKRVFCQAVGLLAYYRLALLVAPLQRLLRGLRRPPVATTEKLRLEARQLAG